MLLLSLFAGEETEAQRPDMMYVRYAAQQPPGIQPGLPVTALSPLSHTTSQGAAPPIR